MSAGGQVPQNRTTTTQQDVVAEYEDEDPCRTCHPDFDLCDLPNCLLFGRQLHQEVMSDRMSLKQRPQLSCIHQDTTLEQPSLGHGLKANVFYKTHVVAAL